MLVEAAEGQVSVNENSFYLTDPNPPSRFWKAANPHENGLIGATDGAAIILTGCTVGYVNVAVELHDTPPPVDSAVWDEIMEISYRALTDRSQVGSWEGGGDELPAVSFQGPGTYRIRIYVRGRELDRDGVAEEPVEDYLLQVWPAHPGPPVTHKGDL